MRMTPEVARRRLPPIYTIYCHPRDFPEHYPVRAHFGDFPAPIACLYETLDDARHELYEYFGLTCIGREPLDDPCIVESWI
jgi:hypothetical protein